MKMVVFTGKEEALSVWKSYIEWLYDADNRPEELEMENELEVEEDERGCSIQQFKVEKAMKNRKACGVDRIPLKLWKGQKEEGMQDDIPMQYDIRE